MAVPKGTTGSRGSNAPAAGPVSPNTELDAREAGTLHRQGGWRIILLIARNVESDKGHGHNRNGPIGPFAKVSQRMFAEMSGIPKTSIVRYHRAWVRGAEAGLVPDASTLYPGCDDPDLPDPGPEGKLNRPDLSDPKPAPGPESRKRSKQRPEVRRRTKAKERYRPTPEEAERRRREEDEARDARKRNREMLFRTMEQAPPGAQNNPMFKRVSAVVALLTELRAVDPEVAAGQLVSPAFIYWTQEDAEWCAAFYAACNARRESEGIDPAFREPGMVTWAKDVDNR